MSRGSVIDDFAVRETVDKRVILSTVFPRIRTCENDEFGRKLRGEDIKR